MRTRMPSSRRMVCAAASGELYLLTAMRVLTSSSGYRIPSEAMPATAPARKRSKSLGSRSPLVSSVLSSAYEKKSIAFPGAEEMAFVRLPRQKPRTPSACRARK
eukprot:2718252-Pyramimonas_sp.AAC.2